MDLQEAEALCRREMNRHGIPHWKFEWMDSRRTYGRCRWKDQTILLSRPLVGMNSRAECHETILHEIAHAHAGPCGHDYRWQEAARRLGAKPVACFGAEVRVPSTVTVMGKGTFG